MNSTTGRKLSNGAEQWFQNGVDAMNRRNWEYGMECLGQAIRRQPDELEYRKQKHRCSRRKFGKPGPLSKVATVKLAALRSRIMTANSRKDWLTLDQLAEDGISLNPWDAQMFAVLAKSATDAGRTDIARYGWSTAIKIDKKNANYYRAFGSLLQANGEYELAKGCFQRIQSIDPTGRIAKELICSLDVAAMIDVGGYAGAMSTRDVERGVDRKGEFLEEARQLADSVAAQEKARRQLNQQLVSLIDTGEQQIREGHLCSALQTYGQVIRLAPKNLSIRKRMEDVELTLLRKEAVDAQIKLVGNPACSHSRVLMNESCAKLASREREVFSLRVQNSPGDLLNIFQLADFHRRAADFIAAIPLFQKVIGNDPLRGEALIGLGECWVRTGQTEPGKEQLLAALKTIVPEKKPNAFKLAHYWLGRLHESRQHFDQAKIHYSEIAAIDSTFRDVNVRMVGVRT